MFDHLQIDDRRERWLVGCADLLMKPFGDIGGWRRADPAGAPRRVLLFRLERIGDLLMTLDAIGAVRRLLPDGELHLVVGSWNAELAGLIPAVDRVETLDVPWLSRGRAPTPPGALAAQAARWRREGFDLAINFEPDIRSNLLAAASGAARRVGFASKGGGAFLTHPHLYDPSAHVAANALRLVERTLPSFSRRANATGQADESPVPCEPPAASSPLRIPEHAHARAERLLAARDRPGPLIGLNPAAGRAVKEWPAERFATAAARLAERTPATFVLLGTAAERAHADAVTRALPASIRPVDLVGRAPLVDLAAILQRMALLITGDTGPMHLAAAVGTPVLAIFGPTDPRRYAPLHTHSTVIHADLWCRPCNRVRRPPARCRGVTPDCLTGVSVEAVVGAALDLLTSGGAPDDVHLPPSTSA